MNGGKVPHRAPLVRLHLGPHARAVSPTRRRRSTRAKARRGARRFRTAARHQAAAQQVLLPQGRPPAHDLGLRRRGPNPSRRAIPRICSASIRSLPATRPRRPRSRHRLQDAVAGLSRATPPGSSSGAVRDASSCNAATRAARRCCAVLPSDHDRDDPASCLQRHEWTDHRRVLRADGARPVAHPQPQQRDQLRPWRLSRHRRLHRLHDHAVRRLLGRAADRAAADGHHRPGRRAGADPAALRARSALQPPADLRPRVHHRGRHALHLGRAGQAGDRSGHPRAALEQRVLLHHRLSPVHGGDGGGRRGAAVRAAALHAPRHPHPRGHARPRDRLGAGHQRADAALAQLRRRHLSRRA